MINQHLSAIGVESKCVSERMLISIQYRDADYDVQAYEKMGGGREKRPEPVNCRNGSSSGITLMNLMK